MPKRKQRTVEYYKEKIRKLEGKTRKRCQNSSTSSLNAEENQDEVPNGGYTRDPEPEPELEWVLETEQPSASVHINSQHSTAVLPTDISQPEPDPELDLELAPELLSALGDAAEVISAFGEKIHSSLSTRWVPILKKGLTKETKSNLINEYPVPDNCRLLKAPTLNPEISAAIADVCKNKDKTILSKQDQLGHGIAAISKAMSLLLLGDDKVQAIKILTDGCRLLTDLHFMETRLRAKLIVPCLQKSIASIIESQDRDETLFGVNLPEKIKSSKAIEKQSHQIKKVPNKTPVHATYTQPASRSRYQENWPGPPRYPSATRGGRGGSNRPAPMQHRHRPAISTLTPRMSFNQNKPRATRQ